MKRAVRVLAVVFVVTLVVAGVVYYNPLWLADQQIRCRLWREGVRSDYIVVDGYRMHYFEATPPKGQPETPLVLVHGLGARGEDWGVMIPALAAKGFHVYVPDLLGYGRTVRPDVSYSIALQEKTVFDFMQAKQVKRADVGGWSMGGWIAMQLALDHPEAVDRLAVYDSAGLYFPATFEADLFTPHDVAGVRRLTAILTPTPVAMPDFIARAALRKLERNAWVLRRSLHEMTGGRDLLDFRMYRIRQPMLISWGSKDELIPLSVGEAMHQDVPHSVLQIIEGCGHLAPAQCSGPVIEGTVRFLRAQPPMDGGEETLSITH